MRLDGGLYTGRASLATENTVARGNRFTRSLQDRTSLRFGRPEAYSLPFPFPPSFSLRSPPSPTLLEFARASRTSKENIGSRFFNLSRPTSRHAPAALVANRISKRFSAQKNLTFGSRERNGGLFFDFRCISVHSFSSSTAPPSQNFSNYPFPPSTHLRTRPGSRKTSFNF